MENSKLHDLNNNFKQNKDTLESSKKIDDDEPKYLLDLVVSANKLKVYLRVRYCDNDALIDEHEILDRLKEMDIVYGLKHNTIKEYCKQKEYYKEVTVAEGKLPIHGIDASIEYNFKLDDNIEFKEKEDGSVDFKNIDNIKSITKNGVLCKKIEAMDGIDGMDVYGAPIPCNKPKDIQLPTGKNTFKSDDGLTLYSSVDGCIHKKGNNIIDIDSIYTVRCVDQSTGNIDFVGSVVVQEDVKAGFSVKAKNDIVVKGMVEGATLEAGGNITISNGMNGRDVGIITAKGNVTSKYLENATINVEKSVYSDAIINCKVYALEDIVLKGSRGAIIGGECKAGHTIQAKNIGTKNNIQTRIEIDLEKYLNLQNSKSKSDSMASKIKIEIDKKQFEVDEINNKMTYLIPLIKKSPANEKLYKLLIIKKSDLNKEINSLKTTLLELDSENKKITDHRVICSGIIYANTRIVIGWRRYTVRDDISYSKLYNDGNDIQITPLLPSDFSSEV